MSDGPDKSREHEARQRGKGKWGRKGVPRRGWILQDVNDLGPDEGDWQTCEMCESANIRYVHTVEHRDYFEHIEVGCVCSEHLTGDYEGPREREKVLRSSARRRANFLDRQWRHSTKGNPHIKLDGYHVTAFKKGDHWSASVKSPDGDTIFAKRHYPSLEAVQLAAFDFVQKLRQE